MTEKPKFYLVSDEQLMAGANLTGSLLVRDDDVGDWLADCRKIEVPEEIADAHLAALTVEEAMRKQGW